MDFAHARTAMVDSQVRPSEVTEPRLLAALRRVERERFVSPAARAYAYADLEVDAGKGRYLLRPRHLTKLLQALAPQPGERALELAGATGYGAALLAACGLTALSLEPDPEVALAARAALDAAGFGAVKSVSTTLTDGWAEAAPYDVMVLNGAAEVVPEAWLSQLADGGRLGVIVRQGAAGSARIYTRAGGQIAFRAVFDAAPPVLDALDRPAAFAF